ncbi:cation:proton antiporter [Candidatus Woesearchaeota archaeon]|nr:cation:proton antiporter [Candidatus Woesearchaeota archaeon]
MAMDPTTILLWVSFILFFGFLAEFIFQKTKIPDVLLLVILGFVIGPHGYDLVRPEHVMAFAPLFTTFALLFLLYDGAFSIDLAGLVKGLSYGIVIMFLNFFISTAVVTTIMLIAGFPLLTALFVGFMLGGVSSAFVVPVMKQLGIRRDIYSILTLESAFTDVLCIVAAITTLAIIELNVFDFKVALSGIASLFAIAGLVGIVGGIVWIIVVKKVFKEHKSYMMTIAYLLLLYALTEYLSGNGAIAALFFGLMLKNNRQLVVIFTSISQRVEQRIEGKGRKQGIGADESGEVHVSVLTPNEQFFYSQISFFLKTFFFVYIGLLLDLKDPWPIFLGGVIALVLMYTRRASRLLIRSFEPYDQDLITGSFARGLAAAALATIALSRGLPRADFIANLVYAVIIFTIILSSLAIFMARWREHRRQKETPIRTEFMEEGAEYTKDEVDSEDIKDHEIKALERMMHEMQEKHDRLVAKRTKRK